VVVFLGTKDLGWQRPDLHFPAHDPANIDQVVDVGSRADPYEQVQTLPGEGVSSYLLLPLTDSVPQGAPDLPFVISLGDQIIMLRNEASMFSGLNHNVRCPPNVTKQHLVVGLPHLPPFGLVDFVSGEMQKLIMIFHRLQIRVESANPVIVLVGDETTEIFEVKSTLGARRSVQKDLGDFGRPF
jgi:hypothetical protein